MRKYPFDYNIFPDNSPEVFKEACKKIEATLPPTFEKKKLLIDVDGSLIQVYSEEDKEVIVYDDYVIGAVYVNSDIELDDSLGFERVK